MSAEPIKPAALSRAAGINRTYAWQILNGKREPSRELALKIFQETGLKTGPLTHASDKDAEALAKLESKLSGAA